MSEVKLIFSAFGFFMITGVLLGLSGVAGPVVEVPAGFGGESGETQQNVIVNALECTGAFLTPFVGFDKVASICKRDTKSKVVEVFSSALALALGLGSFFFQMLTFQLPIPGWLNAIILAPAAVGTVYVGMRFGRGGG